MNYIKEMNAFYVEIETNPLSTGAGMLWHTLMHVNNRARWVEEFSVAAAVLCYKSGLSLSGFKRARAELKEKGYLSFTSRGTKAPMYRMISLVQETTEMKETRQTVVEPKKGKDQQVNETSLPSSEQANLKKSHQESQVMDQEVGPLYKRNDDKQKETIPTTTYNFYIQHFKRPSIYIEKELNEWTEIVGENLVYEALKRALESGKGTWAYAKGILKKWQKDGLYTIKDVEFAEEKYRVNRTFAGRSRREERRSTEVVPAWFKEMKARERKEAAGQRG